MLDIKSQLGEMHGTMQALDEKLTAHVVEDKEVEKRVDSLEHSRTKHRTQLKLWGGIGMTLSAFIGWLLEWLRQ